MQGVKGVRVIEVSGETISNHPNQTGKHFEEYLAKNIGIRRSEAEHILVINPDVILSSDLLRLCVDRPHVDNSFLRADRLDVTISRGKVRKKRRLNIRHGRSPSETISLDPARFLKFSRGSRALEGESELNGIIVGPAGGVRNHFMLGMHTNAAGDFLATSR
jgi:hypothetical protein